MTATSVLIDSSVWIAAARSESRECLRLKRLILDNQCNIYLIRAIQDEVAQGARSERLFRQVWESLLGFDYLEVTDQLWQKSAWNYFKCRKLGLTLGTLDCLIATVAATEEIPLWTLDKTLLSAQKSIHFKKFIYK